MSAKASRLYPEYAPLHVTSIGCRFGPFAPFREIGTGSTFTASLTYPSANLAIFVPFNLPFAYPVNRFFCVNGSTAAGNIDLGIYTVDGARVISIGATAQAGTSASQYFTPSTPVLLPAGSYYMAISCTSASATLCANNNSNFTQLRLMGMVQQASANPLPSSMTPAILANGYHPFFGFTRTTSGF